MTDERKFSQDFVLYTPLVYKSIEIDLDVHGISLSSSSKEFIKQIQDFYKVDCDIQICRKTGEWVICFHDQVSLTEFRMMIA